MAKHKRYGSENQIISVANPVYLNLQRDIVNKSQSKLLKGRLIQTIFLITE